MKIRNEVEESLVTQFKERQSQLDEQEIQLRKERREFREKQEAFERELERKVDEQTEKIRETHRLELREKDEQNRDLRKQIEVLKAKADRVSPVTKGEAGQRELDEILEATFRDDEILVVKKGARGADILQHINKKAGRHCGTLLWECKNTKNWSKSWLKN